MKRRTRKAKVVYRYRKARRKSNAKSSGFNLKGLSMPVGAMLYGASREKISNMIANSTLGQKLPVSQFTDEIVMLGVGYGARKLGLGKGIGASILNAGKAIEYARIGQTAVDLFGQRNQTSGNMFNY